MPSLYDPARHERLGEHVWSAGRARDAIAAICRDAEQAFDPNGLWPLHPADHEPGTPPVLRGLYLGAAGMLHALTRLAHAGMHDPKLDAAAIAAGLHEAAAAEPDEPGAGASLLVGESGILLVEHALTPSQATADLLAEAIAANADNPANELLLGAPGTMLAARAMHARTGDTRFAELWRASGRTLLARQEPDGLWTQDMYGRRARLVGAGHGFAGNVRALLGAPEWLDDPAAVEAQAVATLRSLAIVDEERELTNWPPTPGSAATRVQWCHGAPGIVTSLHRIAPRDLLEAAGELIWRAGPPRGSAGLCHGTAGNGFAFLALHARTKEELWLDRARTFAMHALEQVERDGRGRYALFTGDVGAALLAAACIEDDARFPGIDDL